MASTTGARSRKRTANQAVQTDDQNIAAAQKARGQRTRQGRKEISSYRGATNTVEAAIRASNLAGLRGTPEGRQLQKEYSGRTRALEQSLPFTIAPAQRELKGDLQSIDQDLAGYRLDKQQHLQDRAAAIADVLKAQQEEAAKTASNQSEKRQGVDAAYKAALRLIREQQLINQDPNADESDKHPSAVPRNELEWIRFEDALNHVEGVDQRSATKALRALRRRIEAVHTPNAGQPSSKFLGRFAAPQGS